MYGVLSQQSRVLSRNFGLMAMQTICAKSNEKLASNDIHKNKFYNIYNSRASMTQIYYYGICLVGKIATQYDFKKFEVYKLILVGRENSLLQDI